MLTSNASSQRAREMWAFRRVQTSKDVITEDSKKFTSKTINNHSHHIVPNKMYALLVHAKKKETSKGKKMVDQSKLQLCLLVFHLSPPLCTFSSVSHLSGCPPPFTKTARLGFVNRQMHRTYSFAWLSFSFSTTNQPATSIMKLQLV